MNSTKENGLLVGMYVKAGVCKSLRMGRGMMAFGRTIWLMGEGDLCTRMGTIIMVSGKMAKITGLVFFRARIIIGMKVRGKIIRCMDKAKKCGPITQNTKDNTKTAPNTERVNIPGPNPHMKVTSKTTSSKAKASTNGQMVACTKVSFQTMSWKDLAFSPGNVAKSTLGPTRMIRRMATELSSGLMEECTLEDG
jgi:hypothetical protein